jgi:hypothetical protein
VDGSVHWEADESVGKAYWYKRNTAAISVEMTAYALEASLAVLDCETAASIAKWLRSSRNSPETFVSVQDTVAVLNALSKFAAGCTTTIKHPPNLCVKVIRMAEPEKVYYAFSVTAENAALMQRIPIRLNDIYKVVTCGTGLGQAQVHIEYNILRTQKKQCAFNMTVSAREVLLNNTGGERYAAEIEFCVRYLGSHCIGFAIVEVELPTGYQACEHRGKNISDSLCLKDILQDKGGELNLDQFEILVKSVVFYFERLCNDSKVCVKFKAYREFEAITSQPVHRRIVVYDYYEPDKQCTEFYRLRGGSQELKLLCDQNNKKFPLCVCAAGRCPELEEIKNRLCQACFYKHFAYKISVVKKSYSNGWWKYKAIILEIIRPGAWYDRGDKIALWVPSLCRLRFDLKVNKKYHLMGRDSPKFVLDHNTGIEPWPESTVQDCRKKTKQECIKAPCKKFDNKTLKDLCEKRKQKNCKRRVRKCEQFKSFDTYLTLMNKFGCELTRMQSCD